MAFTKCPVCGRESQDKVSRCPHCGYPFLYYFLAAGLLAVGTIVYLAMDKPQDKQDRASSEFDRNIEEGISHPMPNYLLLGGEFNQSLVNSLQGLEGYLSEPEKAALNLGVYAEDLRYLTAYDKTQESLEYYHACGRLYDQLTISVGVRTQPAIIIDRANRSRALMIMYMDRMIEAVSNCEKISNPNSCALMITSRSIESLYLSTSILGSYSKSSAPFPVRVSLAGLVLDQGSAMPGLLERLQDVDQTPIVALLIKDIEDLNDEFAALDDLRERISEGDREVTLTNETLSGVTQKVKKIRQSIVK